MDLVAGQSLGRYEITGYVGAGGMGVVYRARDAELGREVAVKVLNDRAASKASRIERFAQEARAVARLSHPNILDIHDFGTHEGITYAVTELLQGQTLADRLVKGPLPLNKGLEICRAIAEGLAAAHGKGIVHRDIKPSNIFITGTGQVKILDFGIARLREEPVEESALESRAPTETLTGFDRMVGTVGYMSPEQIEGGKIDGRSDIFGLGCVMYEVLTGKRAFRAKTSTDTMLAILGKDPEPIRSLNSDVPQAVDLIVQRCLEKQPGERFESARDVAFALRAMAQQETLSPSANRSLRPRTRKRLLMTGIVVIALGLAMVLGATLTDLWPSPSPSLPEARHVAVVPFAVTNGGDEETEFAAGMTDILAADLSLLERQGYGRFWIVPTGDARYMGASTVEELYRNFNPTVVLTGSFDRSGSSVDIDIALIEPQNGRTILSKTIEANFGNVSSFQMDPIIDVTEMLDLELKPGEREWLEGRTTNVAPVFESYVRGRGILAIGGDTESVDRAIALLEEAVERDPLFAPARETLARGFMSKFFESGNIDWYGRAEQELEEVLRSHPSEIAHRALGDLYSAGGEGQQAVGAFSRALEFDPHNSLTLFGLGRAYERLGQTVEAERVYQTAINVRPGYWPGPNRLATLYYSQGRYEAAANSWRQATTDAPLCDQGYNNLGAVYSRLGFIAEAQAVFEKSIEVEPENNYVAYSNLGTMYDQEARFTDAAAMYEKALAIEDTDYTVWGNLAYAISFGAEPEKAQEPFERAIELAEEERKSEPDNPELLIRLSGYYWMIDDSETCHVLMEEAINLDPSEPHVLASIGELYEDTGDRERALEWIGKALEAGTRPQFFSQRPLLRDLVADRRYRDLVERAQASPMEVGDPS